MKEILKYAIEHNASDIHITENKIGWVRIKGELEKYERRISLDNIDEFIERDVPSVFPAYRDMRENRRINPIDGAFKFMDRRFRINIYLGMHGINIALRLLSDTILPLEELFLPPEIELFAWIKSGLYLVVGTTGSGKVQRLLL